LHSKNTSDTVHGFQKTPATLAPLSLLFFEGGGGSGEGVDARLGWRREMGGAGVRCALKIKNTSDTVKEYQVFIHADSTNESVY